MSDRCPTCGQATDPRSKPVRGSARRYFLYIEGLEQKGLPEEFRDALYHARHIGRPCRTVADLMAEMRNRRMEAKLSMEVVTAMIGYAGRHYNRFEAGDNVMPLRRFLLLCQALGVVLVPVQLEKPDPLLYGVEPKRNRLGEAYPQLMTTTRSWKKRKTWRTKSKAETE